MAATATPQCHPRPEDSSENEDEIDFAARERDLFIAIEDGQALRFANGQSWLGPHADFRPTTSAASAIARAQPGGVIFAP